MRFLCLRALPLLTMFAAAGCSQATSDQAASGDADELNSLDSAGNDVQVLQVWLRGRAFPSLGNTMSRGPGDIELQADTTRCKLEGTSTWNGWTDQKIDCSDLLRDLLAEGGVKAPSLSSSRFNISTRGAERYVDPDFCKVLELRVLMKDAAYSSPTFAGVGFHTSNGDAFASKAELVVVGHSTLKSGEAASVLRFTSQSTCISGAHNSTSGNTYQTFEFKPYARFDVTEGGQPRSYRVWEAIEGNHRVGKSWPGRGPVVNAEGFDRQGDLLKL